MSGANKVILAFIIIVIILAAIWLVFGGEPVEGPEPEAKKVIKIGAILPLTGAGAVIGEAERNGLIMAQEEVNARGGINGSKLEIIFEDSELDPNKGVSATYKLIDIDNAKVLINTGTAICKAVQPIIDERKIIQFAMSLDPTLADESAYTFRIFYNLDQAVEKFLEYINASGVTKVAVIYQNNEAILRQIDLLKKGLSEQQEVKIVAEEVFNQGESDFRTHITKIKSVEPNLLVVLGYGFHFQQLFTNLKELGMLGQVKILGGLDFLEVPTGAPKELFDGVVFVIPAVNVITASEKTQKFIEKYVQKYGKKPGHHAVYAYDIIMMLSDVIKENGYSIENMRAGLLRMESYEGASGRIEMLSNGDSRTSLEFATYRNKEVVPYVIE